MENIAKGNVIKILYVRINIIHWNRCMVIVQFKWIKDFFQLETQMIDYGYK